MKGLLSALLGAGAVVSGAGDAEAGKLPPWAEELVRQLAEKDFRGVVGPEVRDSVMRELERRNTAYTNPFYGYSGGDVGHLFKSRVETGKMTPEEVGSLVVSNLDGGPQRVLDNRPGNPWDPREVVSASMDAKKSAFSPVLPGGEGEVRVYTTFKGPHDQLNPWQAVGTGGAAVPSSLASEASPQRSRLSAVSAERLDKNIDPNHDKVKRLLPWIAVGLSAGEAQAAEEAGLSPETAATAKAIGISPGGAYRNRARGQGLEETFTSPGSIMTNALLPGGPIARSAGAMALEEPAAWGMSHVLKLINGLRPAPGAIWEHTGTSDN